MRCFESALVSQAIQNSLLPPHMNLHLAKLHNHGFVRTIYGFEVKVFDDISGVEATKFPIQLEVYMCCRPRANLL